MTRKTLFQLAGASLVLFTIAGWALMQYFGPQSLLLSLNQGLALPLQLLIGASFGLFLGVMAWWLISQPYFYQTREFFINIIGPWKLSWMEIVFVSCCAGIGEEILFRGAIQPWLGIWWTSLLFVVLHGYISPFNIPLSAYGFFMVLVIVLIGWAAIELGLIVAITAHTIIDVVLLHKLTRSYPASSEDTFSE